MTGIREIWLLAWAAFDNWLAALCLDSGKALHLRALDCELQAEVLKQNRAR